MIYHEKKCRHYFQEIIVGDRSIYCSALNNDRNRGGTQPTPDFGLYADYRWNPTWRNELINWPDFGTPADPYTACAQISDAFALAKSQKVEIGCIGGHGRTGTILSCMFSHALKIGAKEAINLARDIYCPSAVETLEQEKFVHFYYMMVVDLEKGMEQWPTEA
jgi:hypothetical protein